MAVKKLDVLYTKNNTTKIRCSVERWEFHDTIMGEQYISFNLLSEKPIEWAIGDYVVYRGQTYYLNYIPTCVQTARIGETGNGFAYEQIKLDSAQDELQRCALLDITPTTGDYVAYEGTNYTGSSVFSLFCGETVALIENPTTGVIEEKRLTAVTYLAGIIQANLNRLYGPNDGWVVRVNYETTHTDDFTLNINNWTVAQALQEVHNTFKLDYVVQGRTILIGFDLGDITGAIDEEFLFGYGEGYPTVDSDGKGLFKIKRTANSSQKIVTRLRAVGSTKNMPYRYYNKNYPLPQSMFVTNLQLPNTFLPYSIDEGQGTKVAGNAAIRAIYPDVRLVLGESNDAYIDKNDDAANCPEGIREAVAFWDGSDAELEEIYPTIKESTYGELRAALIPDQDGTEGQSAFPNYGENERIDTILNIDSDVNVGDGIMAESSIGNANTVSRNVEKDTVDIQLSQMTRTGNTFSAPEVLLFQVKGVDVGKYQMSPVITGTVKLFGALINQIQDATHDYFLGWKVRIVLSNGTIYTANAEYPTLKTFGSGNSIFNEDMPSLPINLADGTQYLTEIYVEEKCDVNVYFAPFVRFTDTVPSSGEFLYKITLNPDMQEQEDLKCEYVWGPVNDADVFMNAPFHIMIKDMGIDFKNINNTGTDPVIHMNSGGCVGREFKISDAVEYYIEPNTNKKGWKLELTRVEDSSIHAYYPNENQQINKDDEFVILNIDFPEAYIKAAEIRLLRAATDYLADNCETKYTYEPFIDDIYLQRNIDFNAKANTPTKSVYWNLYAGYKFSFRGIPETTDTQTPLPIVQSVTIQSVSIKEGEKDTPQVELVLNNDLEQSTIQKLTVSVDRIYGSIFNQTSTTTVSTSLYNSIARVGGNYFLSKRHDDTAQGRITFADGWTANGAALLNSIMKSGNFVSGLQGWQMDALGNGEVESMRVRSVLEVTELLINRMQAQEGDTLFTDNDQIEDVEEVEVGGETLYILTLKEKWEGYFTAQQYGNVIKGIINTLAAKEAGISDYQSTSVETDGANKFYTSWMRVEADRDTDQSLGDNQIMVSLYGDSDTPAGKNFPPCKLMTIARWGCYDYSDPTSADYAAVLASIKRRQQLFYLSAKDGRIVKLVGVDQPKLRNDNIGTSLGTLPDFVLDYANVRDRVNAGRDYLYAQGIVVSDFVKIDAAGDYVCIDVDKGEWQDNTDYLAGGYNAVTRQYERHFVTHRGCRWMCKYNQPRNGVYVEPAWNSSSWQLSEGNQNLSMEIASTNGDKFRRDIVNTVLTPHLFYGNMDITADISAASWAWTRESDSGKTAADTAWDASHRGSVTGVKTLTLTNSDMPEGWSSANRAIFTCTVSVNDGENTVIVQNQATV